MSNTDNSDPGKNDADQSNPGKSEILTAPGAGHDGPVMTAHRAGLLGCRGCGRVWPDDETSCQRCGTALVPPTGAALARSGPGWRPG